MVMKDKLVKNHHKGIYFTLRKMTLVLVASATFVVAVVVPTYIVSTLSKNKKAGIAEEEPAVTQPLLTDDNGGEDTPSDDSKDEGPYTYEKYIEHEYC